MWSVVSVHEILFLWSELSFTFLYNASHIADQMWCLARLLPLMIGDIIPSDDENWQNFLVLLTIMDYVFAPVVSPDVIAFLHDLIRVHHEKFQQLYPECSIIPKLHYMIHIPQWIQK